MGKVYANKSGSIDDKFRLIDDWFTRSPQFDEVITYEGFIRNRKDTLEKIVAMGWILPTDCYDFPRSPREIFMFNCHYSDWC